MKNADVLTIEDLTVGFRHDGSLHDVVHHVSLSVGRGRTLGIVGESGSGKSVTSMSIMHLLPEKSSRVSGQIFFQGNGMAKAVDLLTLDEEQMREYRGSRIAMIFQEPMTSLNPVQRCGDQVAEMLMLHEDVSRKEARQRVIELFNEVMLPRPEKIFRSYPHEISGGQKQRVMIAMALICHPDILIADEPTTALDVTVQQGILNLLRKLQQKFNISIIFISHDLGVVGQIADDVAVMYRGKIVESGSAKEVLYNPQHPYTKGLLACRPPLDSRPYRLPTLADFENGTTVESKPTRPTDHTTVSPTPLVSVRDLEVTYSLRKNLFGKSLEDLTAVNRVSFDIYRGETLGLVGESGCGKSTLGRALLRLIDSSSGQVVYDGRSLDSLSASQMRQLRQKIQIVFQDPYSSLNPRITAGEAIMEPLATHRIGANAKDRRERTVELMERVGLGADMFDRYPHEFSGGQRQRICIARALIMNPEVVICDESVSALDVSVQAQVLNLLNDLKEHFGYTYLFITHDLSVVHYMADRIMVMQQGRIVEQGTADQIYSDPKEEYTRTLLAAIPRL